MFYQCENGALVNLRLVGQIYIWANYDKTEFSVMAETGTSNYDSSAVSLKWLSKGIEWGKTGADVAVCWNQFQREGYKLGQQMPADSYVPFQLPKEAYADVRFDRDRDDYVGD